MLTVTYECDRCQGRGKIQAFTHVIGGTCFKCRGTGRLKRKPAKSSSVLYAVFGVNRESGKPARLYNVKAKNPEQAVKKARVTYAGASSAFRDQYSMEKAVAIRADEIDEIEGMSHG